MLEEELNLLQEDLERRYDHFYHFTTDDKLPSIRVYGLDPAFEHSRSGYAERTNEPQRAMRFFTLDQSGVSAGLSAANARSLVWNGVMMVRGLKPVLLRVNSKAFLSKRFGLDHSFGPIRDAVPAGHEPTPKEFLGYVQNFGLISSYDVILPDELEICISGGERFLSTGSGDFAPLAKTNT